MASYEKGLKYNGYHCHRRKKRDRHEKGNRQKLSNNNYRNQHAYSPLLWPKVVSENRLQSQPHKHAAILFDFSHYSKPPWAVKGYEMS